MADSAVSLVVDILPIQPMRQWVLSVPFPLRFLFASNSTAMTGVLGIVYRAISTHFSHKAGLKKSMTQPCGSHFGNGMVDLIPGSRIGEKHRSIRPIFSSERAKLTCVHAISIERWV